MIHIDASGYTVSTVKRVYVTHFRIYPDEKEDLEELRVFSALKIDYRTTK